MSLVIHRNDEHKGPDSGSRVEKHVMRTGLCKDRGRDWSDAATTRKLLEPPEGRRGKERFSPRAFGGSMHGLTDTSILDFWPQEL